MGELKSSNKPFDVSKREVWEAWEKVKGVNVMLMKSPLVNAVELAALGFSKTSDQCSRA